MMEHAEWPVCLPSLTTLFFLWGYLSIENRFVNSNMDELKDLQNEIISITTEEEFEHRLA